MTDVNTMIGAISPKEVKQVGLVGAGLIGSAWAAHFLARGLDVIATDPDPAAEQKMRSTIDTAWHSLEQLGLAKNASPDRLQFSTSMDIALKDADFIQESTPEREEIKDTVMAAISEVARPDVVIASSTSGIIPSRLQVHCKNPERMIVGHPFNPVYLMPLVEVVGGKQTSPEVVHWAMAFYQHWGKSPLHCRTEVLGHIANRLQSAIQAEAMQLVADGVATTDELDAALTDGPGLRWALIGSFLTGHMASGSAGLRDVLEGKFGASYFSHFQGPELNQTQVECVVEDTLSQVAGRNLQEIEQMRNEFLVGVLKLRADIESRYGFTQGRFKEDCQVVRAERK